MIITVKDTQQIGESLMVFPAIPITDYEGDVEFIAKIVTPSGYEFESLLRLTIPRVSPAPEVLKFLWGFKKLNKSELPIGSKVYFPEQKL